MIQTAHRARVIIASPNLLMLIVQTLQAIFKDSRMREQAGLIKIEVMRLLEDVSRLKDRVLDLQRHFGQANSDLEKLGVSADKITKRGHRIEQVEFEERPGLSSPEATKPPSCGWCSSRLRLSMSIVIPRDLAETGGEDLCGLK